MPETFIKLEWVALRSSQLIVGIHSLGGGGAKIDIVGATSQVELQNTDENNLTTLA